MNRHERRAAASKGQGAAKAIGGQTPAQLHDAGLRHMRAGRRLEAQRCCRQALARDAAHADSLQLMGLLSLQDRQYDDAIAWIARANQADPETDYLLGLGTALEQQKLHEQALKAFDVAVKLKPDDPEGWVRQANIFSFMQQPARAIISLEHALKANPRYWPAANNCAMLLIGLGRFEEALVYLNLCDDVQSDHAPTLQARAFTLHKLERFEEALADGKRAQAQDPANADICNNLGDTLRRLARHKDALEQFDRALGLRPDFMAALSNKGFALSESRRFDEALAVYRRIKDIDPDNADADWTIALIQLLRGEFEAGWTGREARWKIPSLPSTAGYPKFAQPMWRGERDIAGKTILVCADEGLGDTIQFVRYVPMLTALGARVILLPQEALYPLLSELPGVAQCLLNLRAGLPAFDLHCPIMSLPMAFGTTLETIPSPASYLPRPTDARVQAWADRLHDRLEAHDRLRVGLVWSGNPKHWNDQNRSIPLHMFSRLIDADATFVSLQKDLRPDDKAILRERSDVIDPTVHLTDFAETAALIACLDLVITVDTSVAHLAGALGCPTWVLLPSVPDWRWLLDREDSPWYPTMRLFRQREAGDYSDVLERVRTELRMLASNKSRPSAA